MAKRILLLPLAFLFVILLALPASAAPSKATANASGQAKAREAKAAIVTPRGMNRPSVPGAWKSHGHVPAVVAAPQGRAASDPDGTGNGGADKPGSTGGFDADRDGNNGCGNDSDAEDDNNGWCGRPNASEPPPSRPPSPPAAKPRVPVSDTRVLGERVSRPAADPARLPVTGVDVNSLLFAGWGLVLGGAGVRRVRPRR